MCTRMSIHSGYSKLLKNQAFLVKWLATKFEYNLNGLTWIVAISWNNEGNVANWTKSKDFTILNVRGEAPYIENFVFFWYCFILQHFHRSARVNIGVSGIRNTKIWVILGCTDIQINFYGSTETWLYFESWSIRPGALRFNAQKF